jgi:hypothetical protein
VERVQRRLTVRGGTRTVILAGALAALAACNSTDTRVKVGGGVSMTYGTMTTSGVNVN